MSTVDTVKTPPTEIPIDLPSGASVWVRRPGAEFDARVAAFVESKKDAAGNMAEYYELLDRTITRVKNLGTYRPLSAYPNQSKARSRWPWRFGENAGEWVCPLEWRSQDLAAIIAGLYVARHGDKPFTFRTPCDCGKVVEAAVDVRLLLADTWGDSEELQRKIQAGGDLTVSSSVSIDSESGTYDIDVQWIPIIGLDAEVAAQRYLSDDPDNSLTRSLAYKITSLSRGIFRSGPITSKREILAELNMWDREDLYDLAGVFDEHECGVVNTVEVTCSSCEVTNVPMLPFIQLLSAVMRVDQTRQKKRHDARRQRSRRRR